MRIYICSTNIHYIQPFTHTEVRVCMCVCQCVFVYARALVCVERKFMEPQFNSQLELDIQQKLLPEAKHKKKQTSPHTNLFT